MILVVKMASPLKLQVGAIAHSKSRTLLKPLAVPALLPGLGATRMNNLRTPRTRQDNRKRRAVGHELI